MSKGQTIECPKWSFVSSNSSFETESKIKATFYHY